jgi:putative tryptophan/tyrosine transport system substrate-binding protein
MRRVTLLEGPLAINIVRRKVIAAFGGTAVAWPLSWLMAACARQPELVRRIGALMPFSADDQEAQARNTAFLRGLRELGWTVGRDVRIHFRWGTGDPDRNRRNAAELVALAPDVILATGNQTLGSMQRATRIVPIVFVQIVDPLGSGAVASLAHPGGNATGFSTIDYGICGKWLELLREIAPNVERVAVLRDHTTAAGFGQLAAIQAVAPSFRVELQHISIPDAGGIERAVAKFARDPNGGLIVTDSGLSIIHRELIIELASRYRLPAIYAQRFFVTGGGLISYGNDTIEPYRRAAGYVDRILKDQKPADLPVQAPTKYELVLNLKTAKALGLDVPTKLLARADEVIE